jgi:hypothetical protein
MMKRLSFWQLPSILFFFSALTLNAEPLSDQPPCKDLLTQLAHKLGSSNYEEAVTAANKIQEHLATETITDWEQFEILQTQAYKVLGAHPGMNSTEHPVGEVLEALKRARVESFPALLEEFLTAQDVQVRERNLSSLFLAALIPATTEEAQSAIFRALDDEDPRISEMAMAGIWNLYSVFKDLKVEDNLSANGEAEEQEDEKTSSDIGAFNASADKIENEIFIKALKTRMRRLDERLVYLFGEDKADELRKSLKTGEGLLPKMEAEALLEAIFVQAGHSIHPKYWTKYPYGSMFRHEAHYGISFVRKWEYLSGQGVLSFSPEIYYALQSLDPEESNLARFWAQCFIEFYNNRKNFIPADVKKYTEIAEIYLKKLKIKRHDQEDRVISLKSKQRQREKLKMINLAIEGDEQLVAILKEYIQTYETSFSEIHDEPSGESQAQMKTSTLDQIADRAGNHELAKKLREEFLKD